MPDWVTHVLVAYALATGLSVRYAWIGPQHVTLCLLGALVPDLAKIELVVPSSAVSAVLGVPWDWAALHTLGGTLIVVALIGLALAPDRRREGVGFLALGAASHHALDLALTQSGEVTYRFLWPVSTAQLPASGYFRSGDLELVVVAALFAAAVWVVRYGVDSVRSSTATDRRTNP